MESIMRNEKITLACMTTPRLDNLKRLLPKVLPFVDKAVIVVGKEVLEADSYLASLGPKVQRVYRRWDDSFANQWNEYLKHISGGWCLVLDDDEIPSDNMLESLDGYINASAMGQNFCCVEFQSNAIYIDDNGHEHDSGPNTYWRQIFFRKTAHMTYKGGTKSGCHQYLTGYQNNRLVRCPAEKKQVYYHIKSVSDEHRNAARNYFIYGIWFHGAQDGVQMADWCELKSALADAYPTVRTWTDFEPLLISGNIEPKIKEWMTKWWKKMNDPIEWQWAKQYNHDGSPYNEGKALISYYFKYLHSEECPEEIKF